MVLIYEKENYAEIILKGYELDINRLIILNEIYYAERLGYEITPEKIKKENLLVNVDKELKFLQNKNLISIIEECDNVIELTNKGKKICHKLLFTKDESLFSDFKEKVLNKVNIFLLENTYFSLVVESGELIKAIKDKNTKQICKKIRQMSEKLVLIGNYYKFTMKYGNGDFDFLIVSRKLNMKEVNFPTGIYMLQNALGEMSESIFFKDNPLYSLKEETLLNVFRALYQLAQAHQINFYECLLRKKD